MSAEQQLALQRSVQMTEYEREPLAPHMVRQLDPLLHIS